MRIDHLKTVMASALRSNLAGRPLKVPEGGRLVWSWFVALHGTRTSNGYGPNPIDHLEIEAYARTYRWPLEPRHVDLILALDRVWLDHVRSQQPGAKSDTVPRSSGQVVTPEAFDAVFG